MGVRKTIAWWMNREIGEEPGMRQSGDMDGK